MKPTTPTAQALKAYKLRTGSTYADLSTLLGVSARTIQAWGYGRNEPMGLAKKTLMEMLAK